jgi:hypothetical protein
MSDGGFEAADEAFPGFLVGNGTGEAVIAVGGEDGGVEEVVLLCQ